MSGARPPRPDRHAPRARWRRRAARTALALACALPCATAAAAQSTGTGAPAVRLVSFVNEPRQPELGEVFDLRLTLRMGPRTVAFLPDTLLPAEFAASGGRGTWELGIAPGDSIDVRASYPVLGLELGGVELPSLELWTRAARAGETAGPHAAAALSDTERTAEGTLERLVLPIGGALIMPLTAMEGADAGLLPEPPADVLGGEVSGWLIGALAALGAAVALGAVLLAGRLRRAREAGPAPRFVALHAKKEALRQLDEIRARGWHADGRLVDFYEATTGVLRRLAADREPELPTALTSYELLARLEERAGRTDTTLLADAIGAAERAKFGGEVDDARAAEEHWAAVRAWIAALPEA